MGREKGKEKEKERTQLHHPHSARKVALQSRIRSREPEGFIRSSASASVVGEEVRARSPSPNWQNASRVTRTSSWRRAERLDGGGAELALGGAKRTHQRSWPRCASGARRFWGVNIGGEPDEHGPKMEDGKGGAMYAEFMRPCRGRCCRSSRFAREGEGAARAGGDDGEEDVDIRGRVMGGPCPLPPTVPSTSCATQGRATEKNRRSTRGLREKGAADCDLSSVTAFRLQCLLYEQQRRMK
ncbi:hypothetical protein B0H13DRAFT_1906042 [Mycena leptocephala]|nr:hypothetical protein B0H13DRAFT_1906042 [Mycena leptocephala]